MDGCLQMVSSRSKCWLSITSLTFIVVEMDITAKTEPKYNIVTEPKNISHFQIWLVGFRWS